MNLLLKKNIWCAHTQKYTDMQTMRESTTMTKRRTKAFVMKEQTQKSL